MRALPFWGAAATGRGSCRAAHDGRQQHGRAEQHRGEPLRRTTSTSSRGTDALQKRFAPPRAPPTPSSRASPAPPRMYSIAESRCDSPTRASSACAPPATTSTTRTTRNFARARATCVRHPAGRQGDSIFQCPASPGHCGTQATTPKNTINARIQVSQDSQRNTGAKYTVLARFWRRAGRFWTTGRDQHLPSQLDTVNGVISQRRARNREHRVHVCTATSCLAWGTRPTRGVQT